MASFEYDGLNRLTRENISGKKTVTYMYNAAGNLTEKLVYPYTASGTGLSSGNIQENIAYTYESTWSDRLKSYNGQSISYDSAGNPTSYMGKTVTWSHGRMTGYGTTTYGYNDAGIRIRKGTTEYYVEGTRILAEKRNGTMLYYYYDESGVTAFEYGGQMYYYQKNLQGDVIGICDNCGNVLGTYRYDAWGKILSQGTNNILAVNPFRYRGYYYDTETELYYLQTRYYDPETGRFLSADSMRYLAPKIINGLNLYAYCLNNPMHYIDVLGNIPFANVFTKFYQTFSGLSFNIQQWARIEYSMTVNHGQTDETGFFYAYAGYDNYNHEETLGAGLNWGNYFGVEVSVSSDKAISLSVSFTPWLSFTSTIGLKGITLTLGINIDNTAHQFSIGIDVGPVIIVSALVLLVATNPETAFGILGLLGMFLA